MTVCKFFVQGNCRNGQFCRFQHPNHVNPNNYGVDPNRNKAYMDGSKGIISVVSDEVELAEKGRQWPLSCYGPFKERPSIPGTEDVSPEEVRWEMYEAQKTGNVEQVKIKFQQMCQAAKLKRDYLRTPSPDLLGILENLQKGQQDSTYGVTNQASKSNFALNTSQLRLGNSGSNVFQSKPFSGGTGNPFGGGQFGQSAAQSSPFSSSSSSIFGSKPTFGGTPVFGGTPDKGSVFGGVSSGASIFGGGQQNQPTFVSQSQPGFGGINSPPAFSQSFSATSQQQNNVFSRPQTSANVFGTGSSSTNLFGATPSTTTSPFFANTAQSAFGAPVQQQASAFQSSAFSGPSTFSSSNTAFGGQQSAFGAAPSANSVFGQPSAFGATATPAPGIFSNTNAASQGSNNIFSTTNATPSTFAMSSSQDTLNTATATNTGIFGGQQAPFSSASSSPFATSSAAFSSAPFSQPSSTFGVSQTNAFLPSTTSATSEFMSSNNYSSPFGPPAYPATAPQFTQATTGTTATVNANPFSISTSQANASPFGVNSSPFSANNAPFSNVFGATVIAAQDAIDDRVYSTDNQLTDDEKSMFLAEQFILGSIPLKPPTKDIR